MQSGYTPDITILKPYRFNPRVSQQQLHADRGSVIDQY